MVRRIRRNGAGDPDRFEQRALRITGTAFYILTASLAVTSLVDLYRGHEPGNTFWGIVVSLVSIASMWLLIRAKVSVGTKLGSQAILADAACTLACLQLSVVLLVASAGYRLTGIGGLDSVERSLSEVSVSAKGKRLSRRPERRASRAPAEGAARNDYGRMCSKQMHLAQSRKVARKSYPL